MYYYYRYNDDCEIIEKSETELVGADIVKYHEDLDINTFKIIVGYIGKDGTMLRHTKIIRDVESVANKIVDTTVLKNELELVKNTVYNTINADTATLEELKGYAIKQSKIKLETYLVEHPIESTCHKETLGTYSITSDKQQLLTQMIIMTQMAQQNEVEYQPSWNETGKECTYDWTLTELQTLAFEIEQVVRPLISKQQTIESAIKACETKEDVLAIVIDYGTAIG